MTRFDSSNHTSFSEIFGLVVGGGAIVAVISAQVLFIAWML